MLERSVDKLVRIMLVVLSLCMAYAAIDSLFITLSYQNALLLFIATVMLWLPIAKLFLFLYDGCFEGDYDDED